MSAHQRYLEAPYAAADRLELAFEQWSENEAKAVYDELVETAAIDFDAPGLYDQEEQTYPGFDEWLEGRQAAFQESIDQGFDVSIRVDAENPRTPRRQEVPDPPVVRFDERIERVGADEGTVVGSDRNDADQTRVLGAGLGIGTSALAGASAGATTGGRLPGPRHGLPRAPRASGRPR